MVRVSHIIVGSIPTGPFNLSEDICMTIEERIVYACVHTDEEWLFSVICKLAEEGKLERSEACNLLMSLIE